MLAVHKPVVRPQVPCLDDVAMSDLCALPGQLIGALRRDAFRPVFECLQQVMFYLLGLIYRDAKASAFLTL